MARKVTKQKIKYLKDQGLQVTLPTPDEQEKDNKRTIIVQKIIKQKGGDFNCSQLLSCPVIVQLVDDVDTVQGNITTINTAITNLQNATTVEALQDAVAPLLVHNNHSGLTATYDDVNNQIILTVIGGGGGFTCADVATCIDSSVDTQTALLNWLQGLTNVTLAGNWNFEGDVSFTNNTVTFDNSIVDFTNGTTLNYDNTVVSNHNGDTINYDGSTVNSSNTEYNNDNDTFNTTNSTVNSTNNTYNHTGDNINYDATTNIDGGTFNNSTINNPTFTGTIGVGIKRVNEPIVGGPAGTFTLGNIPMGDIQLSVLGGTIQIETSDYSHVDSASTFTTTIDTTGLTLIATYIIGSSLPATPQVQADWQQANPLSPSFIQNKVVRPDQLGGSTTNSSLLVRDTNGTFRDATAADVTALGFSTGSGPAEVIFTTISGNTNGQVINIPHTLGYVPTYIKISSIDATATNIGIYNSGASYNTYRTATDDGTYIGSRIFTLYHQTFNEVYAVLTNLTSTNIELTLTRLNAGGSNTNNVVIELY